MFSFFFGLLLTASWFAGDTSVVGQASSSEIVDDQDPKIQYQGSWGLKNNESLFGGSAMRSRVVGETASLTFTGIGVSVNGALAPRGSTNMKATFSIDGGDPTTFAVPDPIVTDNYRVLFYTSHSLSNGQHTVVVTNQGQWLWLDYFNVFTSNTTAPAPAPVTNTPLVSPPNSSPNGPITSAGGSSNAPSKGPSIPPNQPIPSAAGLITPSAASGSVIPSSNSQTRVVSPISNSTTPTGGSGAGFPTASLQTGADGLPSPTSPSSGASVSGTSSRRPPTGTIVAIAIGGLVLLVVLVLVILWRRTKRVASFTVAAPFEEISTGASAETSSLRPSLVKPAMQLKGGNGNTTITTEWNAESGPISVTPDSSVRHDPGSNTSSPALSISRLQQKNATLPFDASRFVPGVPRRGRAEPPDTLLYPADGLMESEGVRQAADGGVRIAGGADDQGPRIMKSETLPPAYWRYSVIS